jgi:hypothetical protein
MATVRFFEVLPRKMQLLAAEFCGSRNFRAQLYPARGPFGLRPNFIFKHVTHTLPKTDSFLFYPQLNQIYLHSAQTVVSIVLA